MYNICNKIILGGIYMDLKDKIRIVEGFPKEGISFKDITTLIGDGEALRYSIDSIVEHLKGKNIDVVLGPEARGFIFGVPVAYALGVGFIPVRKKGKLPFETIELYVAAGLENFLSNRFGDYMKIPSPERIKYEQHATTWSLCKKDYEDKSDEKYLF